MNRNRPIQSPRPLLAPALLALALASLALPTSAQRVPPDEDWRQFSTQHFVVTYPAPLDDVAQRAAAMAERAYGQLADRFVDTPGTPIQLLLTDHADIANGFATPIPYNQVTIFTRPPVDGGSISYFDDWLEMVITHELVHTFQLDMTGTLGKVVRTVLGRLPTAWPVFPSGAAPTWLLEGLATYYESELTGAGRVKGTWQEMVMRASALAGEFGDVAQVSGHSPVWPAGNRAYVYGARYLEHMAGVHGEESLGGFARSVAGLWVPYRINAAARDAFGVSVRESWGAWGEDMTVAYRALAEDLARAAPITAGQEVETAGRRAEQAVVSPDGSMVAWVRSDGVDATQIRLADPAGSGARRLTRVNGVGGTLSWAPDGDLVFTQLDYTDRYRLTSDLYRAGRDGAVERLTRGERLTYADASPDGRRAVAVQEGGGTNALVMVELATGEVTPLVEPRPDRHWAYPRWSPDGRRIAAVRWDAPAMMDIVVLDEAGDVVSEVTRDRAVDNTPFWSPDGSTVVWSSDRTGIPNLFASNLEDGAAPEVRQVTNMLGGAAHPSVDPAGEWIYFSSYHADGWHIERIPFAPGEWFEPQPTSARFEVAEGGADAGVAAVAPAAETEAADTTDLAEADQEWTPSGGYRPGGTLRPYYWTPLYTSAETGTDESGTVHDVFKPLVGLSTGGSDLVGRHSYSLAGRIALDAQRFAGSFGYSYRGLGNPVLGLSLRQSYDASSRTLPVEFSDGSTREFFLVERERSATLSTSFLRQRYRSSTALSLSGGFVQEHLTLQDVNGDQGPELSRPPPNTSYTQLRATLSTANTQRRALSFSREDGVRAWLSARMRRENGVAADSRGVAGTDRSYGELTGEVSAFKSLGRLGFANHVLALRVSAGAASGPGADQFHFDVGDAEGSPEPVTGLGLFGGSSRLFPVRGYRDNYRSGRIAWSSSVEYRFPLALIDHGLAFAPLFFDRIHGSLFFDAGNAWGPVLGQRRYDNPRQQALASVGAELSMIVAPIYLRGINFRFGAGVPLNAGDGAVYYIRVGNAF